MNRSVNEEYDKLKQYLRPDLIEKAPEDFTSGTMERINRELLLVNSSKKEGKRSLVPLLATLTAALLILTAFILPESSPGIIPNLKELFNSRLVLPGINLDQIQSLIIPNWIIYLIIGIFFLSVFDKVLFRYFHRQLK